MMILNNKRLVKKHLVNSLIFLILTLRLYFGHNLTMSCHLNLNCPFIFTLRRLCMPKSSRMTKRMIYDKFQCNHLCPQKCLFRKKTYNFYITTITISTFHFFCVFHLLTYRFYFF